MCEAASEVTFHDYRKNAKNLITRYKFSPFIPTDRNLDGGREEHDAAAGAKRSGRQVVAELGLDHAVVAVRAGHAAPHDADLGAVNLALGLVDVCDALKTPGKRYPVSTCLSLARCSLARLTLPK